MTTTIRRFQSLCLGCMNFRKNISAPCQICGRSKNIVNKHEQLIPGSILAGHYLIGRALGQGGFGITYLAFDLKFEKKVAVKEFFPHAIVTRKKDHYTVIPSAEKGVAALFVKGLNRFFKEAQILAKFAENPYIVGVNDFFYENATSYIVMDFVEGVTFKNYLISLKCPMYLGDVLALLEPIAESLETVHARGLLHRDISPDNIILTGSGVAKLLDFGAARSFSLEGELSNTINVKMGYAPPEQFQTHGKQGPWTDVYALAATIYRAITGQKPVSALDRWYGEDTLIPPRSLGAIITMAEEYALLKGLAMETEKRSQSIEDFFSTLKRASITTKKY